MDTTPRPTAHRPASVAGHPRVVTTPSPAHDDHPDDAPVVLAARALRCRYGTFEAVRGIDLSVRRGELFALLGTNGAGKTTTLETLEGHRRPDGGHVEVFGRDPQADRRQLAARMGVVFQRSGLPADLTPREMLTLWRRLNPDASGGLDVDAALTRVELHHRADVRIRQLSGGEQRRLDLAVALLNGPELLFLDEPTTGMDPQARERTWQIIRDLLDEGVTIVLTTHYLEEAEALADRLAILHEGRIALEGTLAEVVAARPATVRARLPQDAPPVPTLGEGTEVDAAGRLRITTRRLQHDLFVLLTWADRHGLVLDELEATDASLAQVFHDVAGATPAVASATDTDRQEVTR